MFGRTNFGLSDDEIRSYFFNGFVLKENVFSSDEVASLRQYADEIANWPASPLNKYTQHYEFSNGERRLCRVESIVNSHEGIKSATERVASLLEPLFGERAVLFKDKLNYKLANGGIGYAPHADGPSCASLGLASNFITCQIAIDDQTEENGCLWGVYPKNLCEDVEEWIEPADENGDPDLGGRVGQIYPAVAAKLPWQPLPAPSGSVLIFNHWFPHRSPPNFSAGNRRTAYLLYNAESEGNHYDLYYYMMSELRKKFSVNPISKDTAPIFAE